MLLALCVACAAGAQTGAGAAPQGRVNVRVRAKGESAVVTERGRAHTLDLSKHIDAERIEEVSVLFLSRAGGFTYLLLDVCGLSKVPPDDRQCGAGTECNVVWLKLDAGWRVHGAQNQRYESCWAPVTSDEGPKVQGQLMTLTLEDFREEVRREVTYDADNPEAGLTVKQTPIPKTTP
ncbi:MAG: hypothetical protein QOH49_1418 [Acidobacteriota bacterium]|nr:hypothetical protein [Acidobacteriota bacterium]